jgi:hypothetical protein
MDYLTPTVTALFVIILIFIDDKYRIKLNEPKMIKRYLKYFVFVFVSTITTSYFMKNINTITKKVPIVFTSDPNF